MAMVYRTGEYVVVRDAQTAGNEWLVHLTDIIMYGPIGNQLHYYMYLNGTFYPTKIHVSRAAINGLMSQRS